MSEAYNLKVRSEDIEKYGSCSMLTKAPLIFLGLRFLGLLELTSLISPWHGVLSGLEAGVIS